MRPLRTFALASVLAFGVATCASGADDAARNRRWARVLCTSLRNWQDATTSSSRELQAYLGDPNLDAAAAKARLTAYLQEATEVTDELADDLGGAGLPAIPRPRRVRSTLREGSAAMTRAIEDAKTVVDGLPVVDAAQFRMGTERANAILSAGFETFDDALRRVNRLDGDGDLVRAERSVRRCRATVS